MDKRVGTSGVDRGLISLAVITALAAVLLFSMAPPTPIMEPDSLGYLGFDPGRTAGYPLFLSLTGLSALIPVQVALYALCGLILAVTVYRATGNGWVAHAALLALFVNPEVNVFGYTVLTEGLFLPISLLFLSAIIVFAYRGTAGPAIAAALLAGLAVAVRPACYPLIVVALIAILLRPMSQPIRRKLLLLVAALVSWGAVVGAERAYSRYLHGDRLTSLAGRHLFAKAALIEAPPLDRRRFNPTERRLVQEVEVGYAPVRQFLRKTEDTIAHPVMQSFYEVCIEHSCSDPMFNAIPASPAVFNSALVRVGKERLLLNPGAYARLALDEYVALWVIFSRRHPAIAPQFDAFMAKVRPVPLENRLPVAVLKPTDPSRIALLARPAFAVAGVLLLLITLVLGYLLIVGRRRDPLMLAAWLCALAVEGMSVFIALTGVADGRYTMGMWPFIVLALLLAFYLGASTLLARRSAGGSTDRAAISDNATTAT